MGEPADGAETRITGPGDTVEGPGALMEGPGEDGIGAYLQGWADFASGVANFIVPVISALVPQIIKTGLANIWHVDAGGRRRAAAKVMAAGQWPSTRPCLRTRLVRRCRYRAPRRRVRRAWNNSETFRNIVIGAWRAPRAALAVVGWFQSYVAPPSRSSSTLPSGTTSSRGPRCKSRTGSCRRRAGRSSAGSRSCRARSADSSAGSRRSHAAVPDGVQRHRQPANSTVGKLESQGPDRFPASGKGWRSRTFPRSVTVGTSPRPRAADRATERGRASSSGPRA